MLESEAGDRSSGEFREVPELEGLDRKGESEIRGPRLRPGSNSLFPRLVPVQLPLPRRGKIKERKRSKYVKNAKMERNCPLRETAIFSHLLESS